MSRPPKPVIEEKRPMPVVSLLTGPGNPPREGGSARKLVYAWRVAADGGRRLGSTTFACLVVATLLGLVPWIVYAVAQSFYSGPPPGPPTNAPCDSGILGCWDWGDLRGSLRQWLPAVAA